MPGLTNIDALFDIDDEFKLIIAIAVIFSLAIVAVWRLRRECEPGRAEHQPQRIEVVYTTSERLRGIVWSVIGAVAALVATAVLNYYDFADRVIPWLHETLPGWDNLLPGA